MPSTSSSSSDGVQLTPAGDLPEPPFPSARRPSRSRRPTARTAATRTPGTRTPGTRTPGTRTPDPRTLRPAPPGGPTSGRHVLVIGADETTDRCGVAAHTAALAEHLARDAASVSVLAASTRPTSTRPGPPASPPVGLSLPSGESADLPAGRSGTAVVRVRRRPGSGEGTWRRAGDELGFLTGALTATLPHAPDVVVAVTPGVGGALAAARIARRHRAPLVLVVHDLLGARPPGTAVRGLTVAAAAERRLLRTASELAVTSPELAEQLYRLGVAPERVHLLPHWVRPDAGPALDRLSARRALGWPVRPFTVVLAGGGASRPDLATVSEAAALLHGEAQIVVLDDGSRRGVVPTQPCSPGGLRRMAARDALAYRTALAGADLLLVAERPDSGGLPLPSTLADYLAAGRPVLAAVHESGSVAGELDRSEGAGLVVRPGDPRLLAAAVRALKADGGLREAMSLAGPRYAAERLAHPEVMRQFDGMLRSALGETVIDLTTA